VAHPFYQRPLPARRVGKRRDSAVHPSHYRGTSSRKPRVIRRTFSGVARLSRAFSSGLSRGRWRPHTGGSAGRDILWRAKCNAFRLALSQHGVTEAEACKILGLLVTSPAGGCELALLANLTGLKAPVLDRALPLIGLQNMVTIEERPVGTERRPVVWVAATDHGRRYAREAASLRAPALEASPAMAPETGNGAGV
jgi:hypothetical protein